MTDQDLFAEADRCTLPPDEGEATLSALECVHCGRRSCWCVEDPEGAMEADFEDDEAWFDALADCLDNDDPFSD